MKKPILTPDLFPPPTQRPATWAEAREDYKRGPSLCTPEETATYFRKYIGGREKEAFLVMFLDLRNHVLDVRLMSEGTVDHTAVYNREVIEQILELKAAAIIMGHNHPSGSLEPSQGDKKMTREMVKLCGYLGVKVHDHVIVAHEGHWSFRQAGLISTYEDR